MEKIIYIKKSAGLYKIKYNVKNSEYIEIKKNISIFCALN